MGRTNAWHLTSKEASTTKIGPEDAKWVAHNISGKLVMVWLVIVFSSLSEVIQDTHGGRCLHECKSNTT